MSFGFLQDVHWRRMSDDSYLQHPDQLLLIQTDVTIRTEYAKYVSPRYPYPCETINENVLFWAFLNSPLHQTKDDE
jgi:hypothetical protein